MHHNQIKGEYLSKMDMADEVVVFFLQNRRLKDRLNIYIWSINGFVTKGVKILPT